MNYKEQKTVIEDETIKMQTRQFDQLLAKQSENQNGRAFELLAKQSENPIILCHIII